MHAIGDYPEKKRTLISEHPIAAAFITLAVLVRVLFWAYTGRIWEDALITLAPARNVWAGNGLTHHLSEARVHSFTSPISVLVPLIGESVHQGLFLLRLSSILAAVAAIYFAYRIGCLLKFHASAQVLVLGYLAVDQLQIFFGMAGMETQMAVAIFLANIYYLLRKKKLLLGLTAGLGILARPEFIFVPAVVGLYLFFRRRRDLPVVIGAFTCVAAPWYLFAYLYYGSIVPNTIVAKSLSGRQAPFRQPLSVVWNHFLQSWKNIAPFKEWFFVTHAPIADFFIAAAVAAVLLLAAAGVLRALRSREPHILAIASIFAIFVSYRSLSVLSTYYMWYLPPFLALLFLVAGYGLSWLACRESRLAMAVGIFVAVAYGIHIPFSFAAERLVQRDIECGVRFKTGVILNSMMGPTDTVILEPLGYIGYAAFNKTTYDYPGLSSKVVVRALSKMGQTQISDLISELRPSFVVLRPSEITALNLRHPDAFADYAMAAHVRADDKISLEKWTYSSEANRASDGDFTIFRRISPPTEMPTGGALVENSWPVADVARLCNLD